ncbi:hypothetical protein [Nonomuraea sp. NPDC049309]|jgi:hypothetical protein
MRQPRFALTLLAAAALMMTGGAAFAEPEPSALEPRVVVDECHHGSVQP